MYLNRKEPGLYEYKDNNQKVIYTIKLTSGSHNKPWLVTDETIDSQIGRTHSLKKAVDMVKTSIKRNNCFSRKIGAVIVRDEKVISTGYNRIIK